MENQKETSSNENTVESIHCNNIETYDLTIETREVFNNREQKNGNTSDLKIIDICDYEETLEKDSKVLNTLDEESERKVDFQVVDEVVIVEEFENSQKSGEKLKEIAIDVDEYSIIAMKDSQTSIAIIDEESKNGVIKATEVETVQKSLEKTEETIAADKIKLHNEINNENPYLAIHFGNSDGYENFSQTVISFFENIGFSCTENKESLCISFYESDKLNDSSCSESDKQKSSKKKKRKRKKIIDENGGLFVLDTMPSLSIDKDNGLKYESKFNLQQSPEKQKENATIGSGSAVNNCFNCNDNHNLKDCPLPRDYVKISIARSKFKNNNSSKNGRYHLEDEQKYGKMKPGKISENLRKALGLHRDQLPDYIYRMRQIGYPPGWLEEAQTVNSDLTVYDFEGKNIVEKKKRKPFVDPEKIIDYPGFNGPVKKGFIDEYRDFGVPPYSWRLGKNVMLDHIKKLEERQQDNCDLEDMELESIMSDKDSSPPKDCSLKHNILQEEIDSPSLIDLESKKNELLAELNGSLNNGNSSMEILTSEIKEVMEQNEIIANNIINNSIHLREGDEISKISMENAKEEESMETMISTEEINTSLHSSIIVKTSAFGTPILKSESPYSSLPKPENFSKDICDVINFENLPNSTGKYKQMVEVLQKVRKTLKDLHENNS